MQNALAVTSTDHFTTTVWWLLWKSLYSLESYIVSASDLSLHMEDKK